MGLFNKIKNIFKKEESIEDIVVDSTIEEIVDKEEKNTEVVKVYEKGLSKSRSGFVSSLMSLTNRYNKINDDYFDELEEILIMADIGVNTVMKFMDRLRDRVKHEKIEDPNLLKEIIVDELFIIYVDDNI